MVSVLRLSAPFAFPAQNFLSHPFQRLTSESRVENIERPILLGWTIAAGSAAKI
jgi:hypothetical protein